MQLLHSSSAEYREKQVYMKNSNIDLKQICKNIYPNTITVMGG